MGHRVAETERTYLAPDGKPGREPDLAGIAGVGSVRPLEPVELDAAYFDTTDLRLAAHNITLRRRTGGDDAGWHLKLPADRPDTRTEVRVSLASGTARTVPKALSAEVAVLTRGRPLVRVVRIVNHRERTRLFAPDGTPLAEIARDHVTAAPSKGNALTWDETEVELIDGRPELLDAVEERLTGAGLRPSPQPSKLRHALGGRVTAPPEPPRRPATAGDAALIYLHRRVADFAARDPEVRRDEPDAVHQMRVATRRLRAALKTYRREFDRSVTEPVADELKWFAGVLGRERDREVLAARFAGLLAGRADRLAPAELRARLGGDVEHTRARDAALRALRGERYYALLDRLDALLADPPLTPPAARPAGQAVARAVHRAHRRLARRLETALDTPPGPERDVALHNARKAAKRARYAAESARPVLGAPAARHRKRLKAVQQALGEHQDSVMSRTEIASVARAARKAGEDTFGYGALFQTEYDRAAAVEAALPRLWRKADRGPLAG